MTKQHFVRAAKLVNHIRQGHWTNDLPAWAPRQHTVVEVNDDLGNIDSAYIRAVWTAEVFINLFVEFNPRFDRTRFLIACGLADKPAKKGRTHAV